MIYKYDLNEIHPRLGTPEGAFAGYEGLENQLLGLKPWQLLLKTGTTLKNNFDKKIEDRNIILSVKTGISRIT